MVNKYAELVKRMELINELEKEVAIIREEIFEEVKQKEGKVENKFGTFLKVITKSWIYPKTVIEKEAIAKRKIAKIMEEMASIKAKSQKAGSATATEFETLRIILAKKIK